jgi:hypothetical protein
MHIPILTSKLDFFAWDESVTSLLRAHGLLGHILDPTKPLDPMQPNQVPKPLPILPATLMSKDLVELTTWWDDDNAAQHVLTSRIGSVPRGLLPLPNLVARTALSIYQTLVQYYGTCSFADCAELLNNINNCYCQPGCVQEYISKWRTAISQLQSARFPFSIKLSISQFVHGLSSIPAFNALRANLPNHILVANDQDYGAFVTLTETALKLITIFRSANQASKIHCSHNTAPVVPSLPPVNTSKPAAVTSSSSTPNVTSTTGSLKLCSNCDRPGHWVTTCFEQGGGMEGRWAEFRKDKHKVVAMLLASLEESCGYKEDE